MLTAFSQLVRRFSVALVCGVACLSLAACSAPRTATPLTAKLGKDDAGTQLEFWHELGQQPMTSHDDAFHGFLLYLDGGDSASDYAGRVARLKKRGLLADSFNRPADEAIQRGTLAVMICHAVDLKGGVTYSLLGPTPRYATRELQYAGLYPLSTPNQIFTGAEYLGIIGRLEDYQRGNAADKPASELLPPAK